MFLQRRGFTLIEIILVLTLLSVIVAIAVPNFSNTFRNLQLKSATDNLVYLMRYAQSRAITHNHLVRLEFDEDFLGYQLKEQDVDQQSQQETVVLKNIEGRLGQLVSLPPGHSISFEEHQLNFFPGGTIDKKIFYVCSEEKCFTISTRELRGKILVFYEDLRKK